jgi:HEPN domain-containing protein
VIILSRLVEFSGYIDDNSGNFRSEKNIESKTLQDWLDRAAQDLNTGTIFLQNGRFSEALFYARLALEKTLKAIFVKATQEQAPPTGSLPYLARTAGIEIPEAIMDRLVEYNKFPGEGGQGDEGRGIAGYCTAAFARRKFGEVENLYLWLNRELETIL